MLQWSAETGSDWFVWFYKLEGSPSGTASSTVTHLAIESGYPEVVGAACSGFGQPFGHRKYLQFFAECEKNQCNFWAAICP